MNEAHRGDLSYGHLGEATYAPEKREWQFSRILDEVRSLKPLGDPRPVLPSTVFLPKSRNEQTAKARNQQIRKVIYSNPVLAPAASFLPPLAQVSEVLSKIVSTHDPLIGELISFGRAINIDNHHPGRRAVDVAAVVGGTAGEAVRFVRLFKQQLKWEGEIEAQFDTRGLDGGEQGTWVSNGGPVQQLCFSNGVDGPGNWLAIRCAVVITILRPLIRRLPISAHHVPLGDIYNSSRLDPNPFVQLSIRRTGGESFVDVSFNPWNDHQFAVLGLSGSWSIWNVEGQYQRRNTWAVKAGLSGHLEPQTSHSEALSDDGWGAILWAANSDTVVVARRSIIAIYDVKRASTRLNTSNLKCLTQSDWILDIKRSSRSPRDVFVLTSARIFWLRLGIDEDDGDKNAQRTAKILLSWWHYRSHEDTSLHILLDDSKLKDTMILLYSRLTKLITGFIFSTSTTQLPQSISDPFLVPVNNGKLGLGSSSIDPEDHNYDQSTSTLILMTVDRVYPTEVSLPGPGCSINRSSAFYQVFTLCNDLSVNESLYGDLLAREAAPQGTLTAVSHVPPSKSSTRVADDSFIVADRVQSESDEYFRYSYLPSNKFREQKHQTYGQEEDPWTIDMEWLSRYAERHCSCLGQLALGCEQSEDTKRLDTYLITLNQNLQKQCENEEAGIKTLLESSPPFPLMDDMDIASQSIQLLIETISEKNGDYIDEQNISFNKHQWPKISSLSSPAIGQDVRGWGNKLEDLLLLPLYDRLIRNWITPLAHDISGRVRVRLGKHLKIVALHLCLASHGMFKTPLDNPAFGDSDIGLATRDGLVLPVRRKSFTNSLNKRKGKEKLLVRDSDNNIFAEQLPGSTPSLNQPSASLPTPNPTPSEGSLSSNQLVENPAYMRLNALTKSDCQPALSEPTTRLLDHWKFGMDPSRYDWEALRKASQLFTDAEIVEHEYRKKRIGREEKRQKRRQENTFQSSSQSAPTAFRSSQASTVPNLSGSSQVTQSFLQPSSQPSFNYGPSTPKVRQSVSSQAKAKKKVKRPGFR